MLGVGLLWNGGGSMSETLTTARRAMLHQRVRFIVGFTITYNVIEAIVAVWAGVLASSAALIGFGLDSVVEVLSAAAVTWQFTRKDPERWETVTVKAIGIAFFALAAYVSIDAVLALVGQEGPDHSPLGLGITALSLVVMPLLAWIEVRTGRELGSKSVMADAKQLILCIYLSVDPSLPVTISVNIEGVGGPSAGMMFSLGIIDRLTPGDMTGGNAIAGTGTMSFDGQVGAIGGIQQKMWGAKKDGAEWFLAPRDNCSEVVGHVPDGLRVVSVSTLAEATTAVSSIAEGTGDTLPTCQ